MNVLLVFILVVLTLGAWYSLIRVIPSCFTSLLRHELWRMRDATVDEIRSGDIHDAEQAERLVRELEMAIHAAPDLSLLNVLAFGRIARGIDVPPFPHVEMEQLDEHDRRLLKERHERYQWLVARKAIFGSPSGWPVLFCLLLFVLFFALLRATMRVLSGKTPRLAVQASIQWRHEVERVPVESALAALSARSKGHRISALV